ncbi:DNA-binding FadR family transcriptional regulator [Microlunatus parietis]|uniref:DNA-binding FadR family transcriptional regulator n=1 Tax=Microlunatus parietis TaxID=682979 RepID=A0A7Y9I6Q7_9ACTN|nr:FadR/GntR family transcriptional regulator [Microlunatus parietis]NYE71302.1 DNA-binding FadR family transcriptional regulator [Microlunatus parietis]
MSIESAAGPGSAAAGGTATEPPRASQTDVVLNGIKQMITTGELTAGSRLPVEKDLAAHLGVSRGSLREGVRALCIMGVLETRQGDGTYVTSLDSSLLLAPMSFMVDLQTPEHRADAHAVRRILETESAGRAAIRIDEAALAEAKSILDAVEPLVVGGSGDHHEAFVEADIRFHGVIARSSGNSTLAALIEALASRTARARVWMGLHSEGQISRAHREHRAIWQALEHHDPDRARLQMGYHLLTVEDFVHSHPTAPVD